MRRKPSNHFLIFIVIGSVLGCAESDQPRARLIGLASFDEIKLQEQEGQVLGGIGVLVETSSSGLLVSDALQPHLYRYSNKGRIARSVGSYGSGPFEFRRIGGVAEAPDGDVIVIDPVLRRTTVLSSSLEPDTSFSSWPSPRGAIVKFTQGYLLATATADRSTSISFFSHLRRAEWTIPAPNPGPPQQYPYWGSVARTLLAAAPHEFALAYSLRYPIMLYDESGRAVDSIPQPPAFENASVPALGAFSGPGSAERLRAWVSSFDVIADLSVVADTFLVVTRGRMRTTATNRTYTEHRLLDIYHLPTRERVAVGIRLPPGAEVLAGGRYLYMLVDRPANAWTLRRVTITEDTLITDRGDLP